MDFLEATTQGLGLALAAGMIGGAITGAVSPREQGLVASVLLVIAGIGAAYLFGASLETANDHPAWPGWFVGALVGVFAFVVIRSVVAGASARAGEGGSAALIAVIAIAAAAVLAALSLTPAAPVSIVVALALVFMAIQRRRRASEKYEGLRILR